MSNPTKTFESHCAEQLDNSGLQLTQEWADWLEREQVTGPRRRGSLQLAGHAPEVLRRATAFVRDGDDAALTSDPEAVVLVESMARLRFSQGIPPDQLMQEFDVLARLLDGACLRWLSEYGGEADSDAVVRVAGRLNRVPLHMAQICMRVYREEEARQEEDGSGVDDFADLLVHELSSPLNAAAMNSQLLECMDAGPATAEVRRLAMLVRRNLRRVDTVLRDVQAASLSAAGDGANITPFGSMLADVMAEVNDELETARVRLEMDEPIPAILVDGPRVKLVLVNLIRNAVKYSDPDREDRCVRLRFRQDSDQDVWWVHVSDNGVGIPTEHHTTIFDRFFRANRSRSAGSGLGLAIVRNEVEHLGGRIEVSSQPGEGTTFRFSLRCQSRVLQADLSTLRSPALQH